MFQSAYCYIKRLHERSLVNLVAGVTQKPSCHITKLPALDWRTEPLPSRVCDRREPPSLLVFNEYERAQDKGDNCERIEPLTGHRPPLAPVRLAHVCLAPAVHPMAGIAGGRSSRARP